MRAFLSLVLAGSLVACAATSDEPDGDSTANELSAVSDGGISSDSGDGTPSHQPCTSSLGTGLTSGSHGRLDGYLVAMVPYGSGHTCDSDSDHLHLQIEMSGAVYDIALNIDGVDVGEFDAPLAGTPWAEGWHSSAPFDFVTNLSAHSSSFHSVAKAALQTQIMSELANANHISVFATKYSKSGAHLVHRTRSNQSGQDGAIVIEPTAGRAHYILVHFPDQSF